MTSPVALSMLAIAILLHGQNTSTLTDAEIQAALTLQKPGGLSLTEFSLMGTSGFTVVVYTPATWIKRLADEAKREFRPFSLADVTPEHRGDVWRVRAYPSTPDKFDRASIRQASNVAHIVMRDEQKRTVVQPLEKTPFDHGVGNALGAKLNYIGILATFATKDVLELWGPRKDREFVITVIGEGAQKDFTVKKKHFDDLK